MTLRSTAASGEGAAVAIAGPAVTLSSRNERTPQRKEPCFWTLLKYKASEHPKKCLGTYSRGTKRL